MRGKSDATPWYGGPPLLEHLETVDARRKEETGGFRLPVQWVCRPNQNFRGFAGTVTGGAVAIGEEIAVLPSGQRPKVAAIITAAGALERAIEGQAGTVTLDAEIDATRADGHPPGHKPPR